MRGLVALVAGAVLSSSLYAAEPTLHTTPDPGVPLVQENADKALKVAYMVLGKICPTLTPENDSLWSYSIMTNEKATTGGITIMYNGQVLDVTAMDLIEKPEKRMQDSLNFQLYPPDISLDKAKKGKGVFRLTHLSDLGLDGNVNLYFDMAMKAKSQTLSQSDYQQKYLAILDSVLAACEGAKQ